MSNDNLSSKQKKGNGSKPEALWLESMQMKGLYELYEYLSRRYNFGDKPYSDILSLAIQFHWYVISDSDLRCFKLKPSLAISNVGAIEPQYSSIQISKSCYVGLNDLCRLYSQTNKPCSRRCVCLMCLSFLKWYLFSQSEGDGMFYEEMLRDRRKNLHKLSSRFDSVVDYLLPQYELPIEEVGGDE